MTIVFSPLRSTGLTFVGAGLLVLIRGVIELWDPIYWHPETTLDYAAALLTTLAWLVTGLAFVLWFRSTHHQFLSWILLVAGAAIAVSGFGNLLEDVFDIGFGEVLFTGGGVVGVTAVLVAAVVTLTISGPVRWSSVFLFAFIAGSIFPDDGGQFVMGFALIGLGFLLMRSNRTLDAST
jgi:hypothetical protein